MMAYSLIRKSFEISPMESAGPGSKAIDNFCWNTGTNIELFAS